jgi:DNA-binding Xre family transcriptional regulator
MPYYSAYTEDGRLQNTLSGVLCERGISSFRLSVLAGLSATTTRNIYSDPYYIPSPSVLERICLVLEVQPGDVLIVSSSIEEDSAVCSGV